MEFIKWIPTRVKELQNKSPEEIAMTLNKLSKTPEGQKQLETLIQEFKSENAAIQPEETGMFKKGGKLNYLVNKFQNGGTSEQRKSDLSVKKFHGTDLFEYGPNSRKGPRGYIDRPLVPGVNKTILPNGVGLRQITRDNITTSELVSPDKRDTLYIHNGVRGRVDSNIDDSGFLGFLGLRESSPVSSNFRRLQRIFNAEKFDNGGTILDLFSSVSNNNLNRYKQQIIDRVNNSKANFIQRAKDPNSPSIKDWRSDNETTHKLGYVTTDNGMAIVYPEVSANFEGKLTDFTNPEIKRKFTTKHPGLEIALNNRDTVMMPSHEAEWFTKNYKSYYPRFKSKK